MAVLGIMFFLGKTDCHMAEMAASDCSSEKGECSQSTT